MRGNIYNNPKLAYEEGGFWGFEPNKPHENWCILREMEDDLVLLAPIWFDLMDNLSNNILESCPIQLSDNLVNFTIGICGCVYRLKSDLTTEPIAYMNPEVAKKAYNFVARICRGE